MMLKLASFFRSTAGSHFILMRSSQLVLPSWGVKLGLYYGAVDVNFTFASFHLHSDDEKDDYNQIQDWNICPPPSPRQPFTHRFDGKTSCSQSEHCLFFILHGWGEKKWHWCHKVTRGQQQINKIPSTMNFQANRVYSVISCRTCHFSELYHLADVKHCLIWCWIFLSHHQIANQNPQRATLVLL